MSYIGASPIVGNFQVCDAISVVNNQAAYTMQVGSANVFPESANHMLVSLNGILQKPNGSFTISGSTITFSSNLVTGDVIDFIQLLGDVLDLGTPSDSTVSLAKLTATGTKDSTTFLRGDNTFAEAGGGSWNLLQTITASSSATVDITSGINSTYQNYAIIFSGVVPATDDQQFWLRVSTDAGSSWKSGASDYRYATHSLSDDAAEGLTISAGTTKLLIHGKTFGSATGENGMGTIMIAQPSNASYYTVFSTLTSSVDNGARSATSNGSGHYVATTAVDGIQFFFTSGAVATGNFKLYGIS